MEREDQTDYEGKARELEREGDELEEPAGEVESQIKDTSRDWEAKKSDSQVPGAMENPRTEDGIDAPVPGVAKPKPQEKDEDEDSEGGEPPRSEEQDETGQ